MHELFSDWLEEAGLEVRILPLSAWWDGLDAYCSTIDSKSLLSLLRFSTRAEGVESLIPVGFREVLKSKDPAFKMRDNTFVVAELARAATRRFYDAEKIDHAKGCLTALGLIVGSFLQPVGRVHADHLQKAREYLALRAEDLRARPERRAMVEPPQQELSKALQAANDVPQLKDAFTKLLPILWRALSTIDALSSRGRLQDEEVDILWWLLSEASQDLKMPFHELSPGPAAIIAASELADRVAFPPGPNSAEALLRRVLRRDHELQPPTRLATAVTALQKDWQRRAVAFLQPLGEAVALCPVHLIIQKAFEAVSSEDLPALTRAACDVNIDVDVEPLALAFQTFQERMFLLSLRDVSNSNGR